MREQLRIGLTFGLTSAAITTMGLMVGLHSGTHSKWVVLGGILTIAIADAFSDALGIHLSEESENTHTPGEIWSVTLATFGAKFIFAMTFAVPVLFLPLGPAIGVCVGWGLAMLAVLSYAVARAQRAHPWKVIGEHLLIALVVIAVTHWIGEWIGSLET